MESSFYTVVSDRYRGECGIYLLYARYLCSRDARPSARATIGYLVYKSIYCFGPMEKILFLAEVIASQR